LEENNLIKSIFLLVYALFFVYFIYCALNGKLKEKQGTAFEKIMSIGFIISSMVVLLTTLEIS
jgi:hypothetical protein